jgi:hypothetical protein
MILSNIWMSNFENCGVLCFICVGLNLKWMKRQIRINHFYLTICWWWIYRTHGSGTAGFNTEYDSLILPDLSGISVYLLVFDQGSSPDYFFWKYIVATSSYQCPLINHFDSKTGLILIDDSDLLMVSKNDPGHHLLFMRISKFLPIDSRQMISQLSINLGFDTIYTYYHDIVWSKSCSLFIGHMITCSSAPWSTSIGGGVYHNNLLYYAVGYGSNSYFNMLIMNAASGAFSGSRFESTMVCGDVYSVHKYTLDPSNIR